MSFFVYSSGHHQDLHAFPTRRSSDLIALRSENRKNEQSTSGESCHCHRSGTGHRIRMRPPPCRRRRAHPNPIDRKSTRLNSSHVAISYAVFCLKKKKKNTRL